MFAIWQLPGSRYAAIVFAAIFGTLATVAAFLLVCSWEYRVATIDFQSRATSYLEFMNADLGEASVLMRSISAFIGSNNHVVSADEFARFSAVSRAEVSALRDTAWAPRVTLAERSKFERDARAAGIARYQIKQFDEHGKLTRALPRPEYYALLYNEPDRTLERPLIGLDLVFERRRAAAARRALKTGRPSATAPMDVLTVKQRGGGVLSYMPVYRSRAGSRDRLQPAQGLVLGVFDIPVFVAGILATHSTLSGLNLYLFNPNAQAERRVLYRTLSSPASQPPLSEQALLDSPHLRSTVTIIDQRLGAIVSPKEPLRLLRFSLFGVTTLIVGFIMTVMSVAYLFALHQRTLRLEALTTRLRATAEEVTRMSRRDALTGMANRLQFQDHLEQALARFQLGTPFALLFLDLDRFKAVNDTLGHTTGDQLLRAVAERINACVRDGDTAARLGGDEFAVLLANVSDNSTIAFVANRLIERISDPYVIGNESVLIGASIGAAIAARGATAEEIVAEADLAMYEAKAAGRGKLRVFERSLRSRLNEKRLLEHALRSALERNELEVHYQPLVNIADCRVTTFEALVRWNHPERGMISPTRFIPIAEQCGLIGQLGAWVLRKACEDAVGWPGAVKVAVNISPLQLGETTLLADILEVLTSSGLPPERLELELTEAVILEESESTCAMLMALRDLGVVLTFDGFGTGRSSLSSLLQFPFDKLKIDRTFLENSATSPSAAAIVRAIVRLGASLNLTTTGEGVETMAQLQTLQSIGCTEAQGYFFSPARPNVEVPSMLRAINALSAGSAVKPASELQRMSAD